MLTAKTSHSSTVLTLSVSTLRPRPAKPDSSQLHVVTKDDNNHSISIFFLRSPDISKCAGLGLTAHFDA